MVEIPLISPEKESLGKADLSSSSSLSSLDSGSSSGPSSATDFLWYKGLYAKALS
jgi:hypothetical protein